MGHREPSLYPNGTNKESTTTPDCFPTPVGNPHTQHVLGNHPSHSPLLYRSAPQRSIDPNPAVRPKRYFPPMSPIGACNAGIYTPIASISLHPRGDDPASSITAGKKNMPGAGEKESFPHWPVDLLHGPLRRGRQPPHRNSLYGPTNNSQSQFLF